MNQILRQQVLERDRFTCQCCHRKMKLLDTHHKIAVRYGGTDSLDNIITLCRKCHRSVEPARKMGMITNPSYRYLPSITAYVPKSLLIQFKHFIADDNTTMTDLITKLMREYASKKMAKK